MKKSSHQRIWLLLFLQDGRGRLVDLCVVSISYWASTVNGGASTHLSLLSAGRVTA